MHKPILAAVALFTLSSTVTAQEGYADVAQAQFATISSWEGRWVVAETGALEIVFEVTARGKTVVERWETESGLHSMTVYHRDGDRIMATHYCPQGNQPRLETIVSETGTVAFRFRDITDLDEGESHTVTLDYRPQADGTLKRTEVYLGPEGPGAPSTYTLSRAPAGD